MIDESNGIREAVQTVPPVAVSVLTWHGASLHTWVLLATLIYTGIQILRAAPKLYGCALCFFRKWPWTCNRSCLKEK